MDLVYSINCPACYVVTFCMYCIGLWIFILSLWNGIDEKCVGCQWNVSISYSVFIPAVQVATSSITHPAAEYKCYSNAITSGLCSGYGPVRAYLVWNVGPSWRVISPVNKTNMIELDSAISIRLWIPGFVKNKNLIQLVKGCRLKRL